MVALLTATAALRLLHDMHVTTMATDQNGMARLLSNVTDLPSVVHSKHLTLGVREGMPQYEQAGSIRAAAGATPKRLVLTAEHPVVPKTEVKQSETSATISTFRSPELAQEPIQAVGVGPEEQKAPAENEALRPSPIEESTTDGSSPQLLPREQPPQPIHENPIVAAHLEEQSQTASESPSLPKNVTIATSAVTSPTFRTTQGKMANNEDDGLVFLVAEARSGADTLLQALAERYDANNVLCASGSYPIATFLPDIMPWVAPDSIEMGCTAAFLRDALPKIAADPSLCTTEGSAAPPDLQPHLDRLCHFWKNHLKAQNDASPAAVIQALLTIIATETDQDSGTHSTGCSCPAPHKIVKLGSDWMDEQRMPVYPSGRKVVRWTRRNYWERYMSLVLAAQTNQWSVKSAEDKTAQLAAFRALNFTVDINEMLAQFDTFARHDAATDTLVEQHASQILWIDHAQWRDTPDAVHTAIAQFLGISSEEVKEGSAPLTPSILSTGIGLLDMIRNGPQVAELLAAKGHGAWVGRHTYQPLSWIRLVKDSSVRTPGVPQGITVTTVGTKEGLVGTLEGLPDDALVVISDAGATLNPHVRTIPSMYDAMGEFRSQMASVDGLVVAETAVTTAVSDTGRKLQTSQFGHRLAAGTVKSFLQEMGTGDEPKIRLDSAHEFFGRRFEGVPSKVACLEETGSHDNGRSLFVYSAVNCYEPRVQYPLWPGEQGIDFQPIFRHVEELLVHNRSLADIDRHFGREILYAVNRTGVYGSAVVRDRYRVTPTESFLVDALELLQTEEYRWPSLRLAVNQKGFGYFGWYGDWKGCNEQNEREGGSVPLFTTCASTACSHSFPSPAYMTIINAQPNALGWLQMLGQFSGDYPHEKQIRKVVWRGGLTENVPSKVRDSVRWRLVKTVHELEDPSAKELFDVGLTGIPEFIQAQIDISADEVGGVAPGIASMNDFQQYSAILDMDGNSWSSRFSTLLCYNSVAIKVEPAYADHFFYDLIPWKHYVPVKFDLSDLVENVRFILDPANEAILHDMVASANQWCMERLTRNALMEDQLTMWDRYVAELNRSDPSWPSNWHEVHLRHSHELMPLTSKP